MSLHRVAQAVTAGHYHTTAQQARQGPAECKAQAEMHGSTCKHKLTSTLAGVLLHARESKFQTCIWPQPQGDALLHPCCNFSVEHAEHEGVCSIGAPLAGDVAEQGAAICQIEAGPRSPNALQRGHALHSALPCLQHKAGSSSACHPQNLNSLLHWPVATREAPPVPSFQSCLKQVASAVHLPAWTGWRTGQLPVASMQGCFRKQGISSHTQQLPAHGQHWPNGWEVLETQRRLHGQSALCRSDYTLACCPSRSHTSASASKWSYPSCSSLPCASLAARTSCPSLLHAIQPLHRLGQPQYVQPVHRERAQVETPAGPPNEQAPRSLCGIWGPAAKPAGRPLRSGCRRRAASWRRHCSLSWG